MNAQEVKKFALAHGADMVGIGSMDRWEGAPRQMDPRYIMPEAKSFIAMGFRVMRGSLRGVEEGTFFSNYSAMGYGGITYLYMPMTVINMCKYIEDEGYEAFPMGHQSDWRAIDNEGKLKEDFSRPVAPGKPAPDIMVHLRIGAFLAGLGEIGYSKMFLSPQYGPRNRVGLIFTEAELEPDPLYDGPPLCNKCMACVSQCPGNAISRHKTVKVTLAGREVEWGELDCGACNTAFVGAEKAPAGEEGTYLPDGSGYRPSAISPFNHKPKTVYKSGQAVCGGRGCVRACMVSMEKRDVLRNKFKQKFRRRPQWKVDWAAREAAGAGAVQAVVLPEAD